MWTVISLVLSVLLWIVVYTLVRRIRVFIYARRRCEKRRTLREQAHGEELATMQSVSM